MILNRKLNCTLQIYIAIKFVICWDKESFLKNLFEFALRI